MILERRKAVKALHENTKCEGCRAVLYSKRSMAAPREALSEKGATEATLAALNLCVRCKQNALIRSFGQHMQL